MACRVRVKLKRDNKVVETSALVNSGFETDALDIVVPVEVAKRLNLWPPKEISFTVPGTGGEVGIPYYELANELELILSDRESRKHLD